jgi:polyisoprenoid-binding protein YceI
VLRFVAAFALVAAVAACSDPAAEAPKAVVSEVPAPPPPPPANPPAPAQPMVASTEAAAPAAAAVAGTTYAFDNTNSGVAFTGSKVTGKHDGVFNTFTGTVVVPEGKLEMSALRVEIDMASVKTDSAKLDGHLQSPELFDVAQFPKATFTSTKIERAADGKTMVTGVMSLHGVSRQITFPAVSSLENDVVTATAEFAINRKDFGVVYPGKPDDLIRDDVLLKLTLKAAKKA